MNVHVFLISGCSRSSVLLFYGCIVPAKDLCLNLQVVGEFETNQPYFPFINSLRENTVRGNLCMPVFGAMTSNSEFEFLDEEAFQEAPVLRTYVSDQGDYEKLIQLVEEKESPEEKLFLFNVTMQNHGGYEETHDNFDQQVWLTGEMEGKYPMTDQYLSLMLESDRAFENLVEYFENSKEPTMIVMFGDHQPAVEDQFFDEIYGKPSYLVHTGDRLMWYKTPFLIWTNYENESQNLSDMGAVYLGSLMFSEAGLELTPYHQFLLKLKEELPVIHILGGYDQEGRYYSWKQLEGENSPCRSMIMDYENLVYNHLFDSSSYEPMFTAGD